MTCDQGRNGGEGSEIKRYGNVIYVTSKGDDRTVDGELRKTYRLEQALPDLKPGETAQLLPGKYWAPTCHDVDDLAHAVPQPIRLEGLKGKPGKPIVIKGLREHTILCGSNSAVTGDARLPERRHFAFFKLIDCEWLVFEDIYVESCWPSFMYIEDSRYVTVRGLIAFDARYLIFARGERTHHLLLESNAWRQDPSEALWRDILWIEVKEGEYFYYNGGLFGSVQVAGSVIIRGNVVCNAFNGVRMKGDPARPEELNLNVEIYDNIFFRIRDNPIEPEQAAVNWVVRHNKIVNAHKWFSMDRVGGGFWYFFANTGWFTDKPGQPTDENTGGAVFKFDKKKSPFPERPWFAFNNSWFLRSNLIKNGKTQYFTHRDNAVLFCNPRDLEHWSSDLPCPGRARCSGCDLEPSPLEPEIFKCAGPDDPIPGFILDPAFLEGKMAETISFDGDLTNKPFSKILIDTGREKRGHADFHYAYAAPFVGDLQLLGEAAMEKGASLTLKAGEDWPGDFDWQSAPDGQAVIGAWKDCDETFTGPPFAFFRPEKPADGYEEMPRVVQVLRDGDKGLLVIHFSTALKGPGPVTIELFLPGGDPVAVEAKIDGSRIKADLGPDWEGPSVGETMVRLPAGLCGQNGLPATDFASVDPRILFC
jgi:hypothetical protein